MYLHVPFHFLKPDAGVEGFADVILHVTEPPNSPGVITGIKAQIGKKFDLDPDYITLFAWTMMGD